MGSVPAIPAVADDTVFGKRYGSTVNALRGAIKDSKSPTPLKYTTLVVGAECWAELLVRMDTSDVSAVGVVEPGASVSSKSAARSHATDGLGVWFAALAVAAATAVFAMARGWSVGGGVVILLVIGVITALLVRQGRQDRKALKGSILIRESEPTFGPMLHGMNRLGQIICAIDDFEAKMRASAQKAQLTPLTLPESIRSAPEAIHLTLWEVANHGARVDTEALTGGIEALTKVVFGTIETTWATFEGFTVPIPEAPVPVTVDAEPEPEPPVVDAARLLKEITEQIGSDRAAAEQTNEEIARINRPETGLGPNRPVVVEVAETTSRRPPFKGVWVPPRSMAIVVSGRRLGLQRGAPAVQTSAGHEPLGVSPIILHDPVQRNWSDESARRGPRAIRPASAGSACEVAEHTQLE